MFRVTILVLMIFEAGTFAAAALRHAGFEILGSGEGRVLSEAIIQGSISLLFAVGCILFWKRSAWSRATALSASALGLVGAVFGTIVEFLESGGIAIDTYDLFRLVGLAVLSVLLATRRAKREFDLST